MTATEHENYAKELLSSLMTAAEHESYANEPLPSLSDDRPKIDTLDLRPNPTQSQNAATAMTAILCDRLLKNSNHRPTLKKSQNYGWKDGVFNCRNVANRHYVSTKIRRYVANGIHDIARGKPVAYLLACCKPGDATLNVWAIPEPILHASLSNLLLGEDGQGYTLQISTGEQQEQRIDGCGEEGENCNIQISTDRQRIDQYDASPDLTPYFRRIRLAPKELQVLKESREEDGRGKTKPPPPPDEKEPDTDGVDDDTEFVKPKDFTLEIAQADLFMPRTLLDEILASLNRKQNVVLQGPPGVGKTFVARRLAYALMGQQDKNKVEMVQFHQSYSYEDFMQGYRPHQDGGFHRRDGVFYEFCARARQDLQHKYVFIIDEINRGNLSKIFGELLMLIEPDKRGSDFVVRLTYSDTADPGFSVPENVYLLGLMNTADRSLAMVDYALRRRFAFFTLEPQFGCPEFSAYLTAKAVPPKVITRIVERMTELNKTISGDAKNLGPGFAIGHSFFCQPEKPWESWYSTVITSEIGPLLREYWFDSPSKADDLIKRLCQ